WIQGRRAGTHIVSAWPEQSLKVISRAQLTANEWTHVTVTYDGSGKAAGVNVYYNGVSQALNVEQDKLSGSIKTNAPFRIGARTGGGPPNGIAIQDLRLYSGNVAASEVETLAKQQSFLATLAKPAAERSDEDKTKLF